MKMRGIFRIIKNHILSYPTPFSLNFNWGFGSLAGIFLAVQIISGVFLAFHYVAHPDLAFFSIERTIMRDIHNGWFVRYIHMNGASFFFLIVYLHMGRSLYYRTYVSNREAWISGVAIFVVLMATAFLGYVLPWSQMSYWAATVITNLFSSIPFFGKKIVYWIWGGYSVGESTLKRFFSLHYFFSFVLIALSVAHIYFVHLKGSTKPLTMSTEEGAVRFGGYFTSKDAFGLLFIFFAFMAIVLLFPLLLAHPDQFIKADVMVTPKHIVPEWYFLPFYAILRSVPNKGLGIILMALSLISLLILPALDRSKLALNPKFCFYYEFLFFLFVFSFLMLGYLGAMPATEPYVWASKIFTGLFFSFFIFLNLISRWSNHVLMKAIGVDLARDGEKN